MPEANPAVAGLLDGLLAGTPVSPELADLMGPPPDAYIPPPEQRYGGPREPRETREPALKKADEKAILNGAMSNNTPTAGYKKFGDLAKMVDTNARVRVMKRLQNGQLSHIEDYAKRDVEGLGDIVVFLNKWVKPVRGGGTYEVSLVDPKGQEYHAGSYNLDGVDIDPTKGPAAINGTGFGENATLMLMRDMLNRPQPLPPDPIEQMQKAQKLMDSFAPKTPPNSNDALIAMMMQSAQAQQQQMIALLTQKPAGPDPMLLQLIERMDRRLEKVESGALAPPPPPPPPMAPSGPSYSIPEILAAAAPFITAIVPLIKGDPGLKPIELIQLMQNAQAQTQTMMATVMGDRLTAKDMLALQRDQNSGTPTLVDQMQQLAAVRQFAAELSPAPSGPQGTTFWDAVVTLASNTSLADGLAERIAKGGSSPAPQPVAIQDHGRPNVRPRGEIAPQAEPQAPVYPANFAELCKAVDDAPDDALRAAAIFETIKSLQAIPAWRSFIEGLLFAIAKNDQARAVAGLGQWFDTLVKVGLISSAGADRAMRTFDSQFVHVREELFRLAPALRPAPTPVETAPAPVEAAAEDEAEDEENEEDEAEKPPVSAPAGAIIDLPPEYG